MASSLAPGLPEPWHWAAALCGLYLLYRLSTFYLRYKELQRAFSAFPGPKRHWLYGNAHEFTQDGKHLDVLAGYAKQYEFAFPMWLSNFFPTLLITHPDYAKAVLSRQGDDFS
ncbi:hypothetical protein GDO81_017624 [Engystomops pustulosus]|uniref:Uncharacterized protein n=1 Tax=Engystomops pustulosus TaxID=76066 RepID=A0AAV7A1U6_ENGPU|nr:hypothetical protein GDO81_017624 [Engystomops pustulosus]